MAKMKIVTRWVDEAGRPAHLKHTWKFNLNRLVMFLKRRSPVGDHSHDRLMNHAYSRFQPRTGGSLRRGWRLGRGDGVHLEGRGKKVVVFGHKEPQASILHHGARIRNQAKGKFMMWNQGGTDVLTKSGRKGFTIKRDDYIDEAWDDFVRDQKGIQIDWE